MSSFVKATVLGGLLLFGTICVAWLITRPNIQDLSEQEIAAPPAISPTPVAFISTETGDSIFVTFGTSTALLNGKGYSNLLFMQVEAASGAKYENQSENLSLWNKGDEVTLQRGRRTLFVGQNQEIYLPSDAASSTLEMSTTTPVGSLSGTYVWIETIKEDHSLTPKQPGVFAVTFTDGTISGATDCNGFKGNYTETDGTISIGALAMTKMFCEGSQEMEFTQQFVGTLSVTHLGATLTLTHSDGTISHFEAKSQ
ncbi:MAG: META domain-containing protein [Patescibacteria group bacterium]